MCVVGTSKRTEEGQSRLWLVKYFQLSYTHTHTELHKQTIVPPCLTVHVSISLFVLKHVSVWEQDCASVCVYVLVCIMPGCLQSWILLLLLLSPGPKAQKTEPQAGPSGTLFRGADQYNFAILLPGSGLECFWHFAHQSGRFYLTYIVSPLQKILLWFLEFINLSN